MGAIHPAKTELGSTLELIAKRLRTAGEDVAREPLPERWVDVLPAPRHAEGAHLRRDRDTRQTTPHL